MSPSSGSRIGASTTIQEIVVPALVSIMGTLIALFPSNPNNMTLPSRDSGVFLYIGWRFLNGDFPYKDVWDHKPPLIYYVDALGIALTPDSLWGIWFIQFIFLFFTLFFIFLEREIFPFFFSLPNQCWLKNRLLVLM